MIVAGIGYRRAASSAEMLAIVRRAIALADIDGIDLLALPGFKPPADAAPREAARVLGAALRHITEQAMNTVATSCPTRTAWNQPSVAEAAALAGAGRGATLLLARIADARVTCALASGPDSQP